MNQIRLKTGSRETRIFIPGSMQKLSELVSPRSTIILADENVLKYHRDKIEDFSVIPIAEGEGSKSLTTYHDIFQQLLDCNVDRSWNLVGIGGGITTDLAGFVASTYFRGIKFGYVSTTLLGQVDAAIGGKNGINYKGYKNLIGVINQPDFVLCDIDCLKTLDPKEFIGGFSEIIKYAFIKREDLFHYLNGNLKKAIEYDTGVLEYLVKESIKTKVQVVESDEFENGDRKLLNFGHTFGHALEKLYGISHGDAVAIGMMLAVKTSVNLGMIDKNAISQLERLLTVAGLPVSIDFNPDLMAEVMKKDKKRKRENIDLILLEEIGRAVIKTIPLTRLNSVLHDLC
ncbi:MAG: 3-dehydroquinate synthase [Bacteroidota bacterium]